MIDKELLQEFIIEVREHIDLIESDLIQLEKDKSNKEMINNIFGSFHSIKGSSGYIGLTSIYELTHALENVIDLIRKDKLKLNENIFDAIFSGLDILKKINSDFDEKGDSDISTQELVDNILALKKSDTAEKIEEKTAQKKPKIIKEIPKTKKTQSTVKTIAKEKKEPKKEKSIAANKAKKEEIIPTAPASTDAGNISEFMVIAQDIFATLQKSYSELAAKKKFTKKDISEISNIFKNLILIAEYQGFDVIWRELVKIEKSMTGWKKKLPSHKKMENWYESLLKSLSLEIHQENPEIEPKKDKKAIVEAAKNESSSEIEDLEVFGDYDKNLVQIFIDTISSNLQTMATLCETINKKAARIKYIAELDKIIQAANYMDIEWIKSLLTTLKEVVVHAQNTDEKLNKDQISLLKNGRDKLNQLIDKWNLIKSQQDKTDEDEKNSEYDFLNVDKELIDIFVNNYNEYLDKIADIIRNLKENHNKDNNLDLLKEFFSLMETSANYMNFHELYMINHDCLIMLENIMVPADLANGKTVNDLINYYNKIINLLNTIFPKDEYIWADKIETIVITEEPPPEEKPQKSEMDLSLDQLFGDVLTKNSAPITEDTPVELPVKQTPKEEKTDTSIKKEKSKNAAEISISNETEQAISKDIKQKTLRVNVDKIEDIMSLVGELVVNRSSFNQFTQEFRSFSKMAKLLPESDINLERIIKDFLMKLDASTTTLGRLINQIQEGIMRIRMLPVSNLFNRFPRMVREISKEAGKQVELVLSGEDTELDKTVIEEISDPLVHIIRNAIDHGIEDEKLRKKRKKPSKGILKISAFHDGGKINIVVSDDGQGIDKQRVIEKALKQKLLQKEQLKYLSDSEIYQFLFHPGFTTSEKVSSLSGRGVGLDVVKRNIEHLNGSIMIYSKEGEGTEITIQIPLTLAIIQALLVGVQDETFCIPITSVIETLKVRPQDIETIEDNAVFYYRDQVISIIYLDELFGIEHKRNDNEQPFIVVVNSGKDLIGVIVDNLIGQHDIVIKPLEEELIASEGISGAAILGSGKIALIIDIPSIDRMHYRIKKQNRKYLESAESLTDETN